MRARVHADGDADVPSRRFRVILPIKRGVAAPRLGRQGHALLRLRLRPFG